MALNLGTASSTLAISFNILKQKHHNYNPKSPSLLHCVKVAALSQGSETSGVTKDESPDSDYSEQYSSARSQLDFLQQLASGSSSIDGYESDGRAGVQTIREQLANLFGDRDDDFTIPLGKNLKKVTPKFLTISQKRNIKRQTYLNEVSGRNDTVFFATIGAFVLLPPIVILAIAVATGYVQLLP